MPQKVPRRILARLILFGLAFGVLFACEDDDDCAGTNPVVGEQPDPPPPPDIQVTVVSTSDDEVVLQITQVNQNRTGGRFTFRRCKAEPGSTCRPLDLEGILIDENVHQTALPMGRYTDSPLEAASTYCYNVRGQWESPVVIVNGQTCASTTGAPPPPVSMIVDVWARGGGTITTNPPGIACSQAGGARNMTTGTCQTEFPQGEPVIVTGTPEAGWVFDEWRTQFNSAENCLTEPGPCTVPMDLTTWLTAVFVPQATVSIEGSGEGSGTVTSGEPSIDCLVAAGVATGDCDGLATLDHSDHTNQFDIVYGTSVNLVATPNGDSEFIGWTVPAGVGLEPCPGTDPCRVTLDYDGLAGADAVTVGARFEPRALLGSVEVTVTTSGVSPDPDGYDLTVAGNTRSIPVNATELFEGLVADEPVDALLAGIANNCTVTEANPQTVTVVADQTQPVTFTVTCADVGAQTPPVLFEREVNGAFEIFAMNPDGSGVVQLTDDPGFDNEDPSWSWDNQKIIFRSNRSGTSDIWVMNADGSNPVQITNNEPDNEDPAFSPDGTKIVYEEEIGTTGEVEIFIADANGDNPVQLTDAPNISEAPQFSPDGNTILFKSNRVGHFEVYTMNPDGSNLQRLTTGSFDSFDPSWSPDGTQIVFSSQRAQPTREDLWIMDKDGSNQQRILFNNVWDWHPVFSTDGSQIIFTSDRDGDYELFRMNADGSGVTPLTNNGVRDDDAEYKKPGN